MTPGIVLHLKPNWIKHDNNCERFLSISGFMIKHRKICITCMHTHWDLTSHKETLCKADWNAIIPLQQMRSCDLLHYLSGLPPPPLPIYYNHYCHFLNIYINTHSCVLATWFRVGSQHTREMLSPLLNIFQNALPVFSASATFLEQACDRSLQKWTQRSE